MKELSLKPILSILIETNKKLQWLFARIQYIVFDEVLDADAKHLNRAVARAEWLQPLTKEILFTSLADAYHDLNVVWNCRHMSEERIRQCSIDDSRRWSRFPEDAVFRDLWPAPSRRRGSPRKPGGGRIMSNSFQSAEFQTAVCKLEILCYRIAHALGKDSPRKIKRPNGLRPDIDAEPFTETEFARRMHRIYVELNQSWALLNWKGTSRFSRQTIRRYSQFPHVFLAARALRMKTL